MKKLYRIFTFFSLLILLILGLIFFSVDKYNSNQKPITYLDGDTDGVTSTELSNLYVKDWEGMFTFSSSTYEYDLPLFNETVRLNVIATAKDKDATVKITGNHYLTGLYGTVTITVSNGISSDTVYTINWNRDLQSYVNNPTSYTTSGARTYTAPYTGFYKLETWGAQGGSSTSVYYGGYGAYSVGVVKLTKGANIYVYVGGAGVSCRGNNCYVSGGYNGGGKARSYDSDANGYAASGGGATHISTVNNLLANLSGNKGSVLIVSGAGGGGTYVNGANCGKGGHGGGSSGTASDSSGASDAYTNGYGLGASQTAGGCKAKSGGRCGGFGYGYGEQTSYHGSANSGGGGSGWYGGGGGMVNSGGGGSGYIGNSSLISYKDVTKHMAGYLTTSANTTASTYTISAKGVSSTPTVDYAKTGDGAAKISAVTPISNDYYLKSITANIGTWKVDFTPDNFEPFLSVGVYNGSVTLSAETNNSESTVVGLGKYSLELGYNYIDIYVTAPNGDVGTYHVTVLRENMKGKHSSEIYRIYNKNTDEYIYTEEKQVSYNINMYKHQSSLDMDIYTFDSDATYTIIGNNLVKDGDQIKILVEAPKVASTLYILTVNKISMPSDDFSYKGYYEKWICPEDGRYRIELWGAQGGTAYYAMDATSGTESPGGYGAYTAGDIILKKGDVLYIHVGQQGYHGVYRTTVSASWNGGGMGGLNYQGAGGGGGATDVRLTPASTSTTAYNNTTSFISRIMVAGAGGGSATYVNAARGGDAGGLSGYGGLTNGTSHTLAGGGTQTSGGSAAGNGITGYFGLGGQYNAIKDNHDAGGGAGWYGGGSGGWISGGVSSGAGGSSYISGHKGCVATTNASSTSAITGCVSGSNDIGCSYHNSGKIFTDTVMVDGKGYSWTNVKGTTTGNMPNPDGGYYSQGRTGNGYAKITPNYQSDNNYLKNLTTDTGTWDKEYSYLEDSYTVTVDATTETVVVSAEKGEDLQTITGTGAYVLDVGENEISVVVTAENGDTRIYNLIVVRKGIHPSSKLYKLVIDDIKVDIYPDEEEYDVEVPASQFSFVPVGYPYDDEATITYSGFGYVKNNKTCYITVYSEGAEPETTTYKINLIKSDDVSDAEFAYTGNIQTYTVKTTGYYLLETWGASGGNNGSYIGGYGAYSTGVAYLTEGQVVYVGVGGQGNVCATPTSTCTGGYNGGGNAKAYTESYSKAAGGGGATHMALSDGLLSSLSSDRDNILIVSGGGGGGHYTNGANGGYGGHGGGYAGTKMYNYLMHYYANGRTSNPANQTSAGCNNYGTDCGSFGQGGSSLTYNWHAAAGSGGGGGFFGGSGANINAGSGGSGYIANNKLITFADYTKHMTCYNCSTSNSASIMTKSTNKVSSSPISDYAKSGNGYAKISFLHLSSDNYLKNIRITDITDDHNTSIIYTDESTDEVPVKQTVTINGTTNLTNIRIESKPNDSTATVEGNGTYIVNAGTNEFIIRVTAENREIRDYVITITREADTNIYPDDIVINGLVQSLCNQEDDYCVQKDSEGNTQEFDKDVNEYYMTVPSRIKQVKFNVIKGHYFQQVTGDGIQDLTNGINGVTDITIDVQSEYCYINQLTDSSCFSHYTYHITRDTSSDTDVKSMFIDNKNTTGEFTIDPASDEELSFDFKYENPDVYDYYFSVPNEWTNIKYFYYEKDADEQVITVIGNEEGTFDTAGRTYLVQVHVLAPNKVDEATYRLHVYRELNSNIYLSSLAVKNSSDTSITYPLNMDFTKSAFDYEVTIPYEISLVNIVYATEVNTTSAILTSSKGTVSGNTISNIPTGKTDIVITTTSEKSLTGVYTITLTREYNDDSSLSNLVVKTNDTIWDIDPTPFDKDTLEYTVEVDEGITSVDIIPTVSDTVTPATYTLLDNNSIIVGTNTKRVLVTAEDKSYTTYVVNIIRPASTDATLKELNVIGSDSLTYGVTLEEDVYEYEVDVPNSVSYVNVNAIKNSVLATISGTGKYFLKTGENSITVYVQAENQLLNTYVITINRAYSSNANLSSISGSTAIDPSFTENHTEYTITVPYTTTKMNLVYTPSEVTTSVTAKNENNDELSAKVASNTYTLPMNLVTGNNRVKLITLAEDKISTKTYNVNVIKEPSDDNTLKTIRLKETRLIKGENDTYIGKLPYNVDPAHLIIEVNDTNSNYLVTVPEGLTFDYESNAIGGLYNETNENIDYSISIAVTAEDNSIKVYTLVLTMQALGNASNYLTNLTVDKGTLTPTFNKEIMYYEDTLENNQTSITIGATLEDEDASVSGIGTFNNLHVGDNEYNVTVTASDGFERVYQVIVNRKPSSDATLAQLSIKGSSLSPTFNSNTYTYDANIDGTFIDFSNIVTNSEFATYEVLNNEAGTLVNTGDTAEITIKVTAEDKVTTKEYKINATKLPSGNNNLSSLSVVGYTLTPTFDKNVTIYRTTVENEVSSVLIEAIADDEHATIIGDGVANLITGVNNLSVDVTSESGVTKSYLLIITREYSNNAFIEYLNVNNGQMNQVFDKNTTSYDVVIDYSINSLDLSVILENNGATYTVSGNNITGNTGEVTITVTAENKTTTKVYTLNVTKDLSKNALLRSLSESNYEFKSSFNSYVFNYDMVVNYETSSLDLTAIPFNTNADVEILNNTLTVGDNTVTVRVTSEDESVVQEYTINVTRNKEVNNYLDYLFNDYNTGDFNEVFSKTRLKYTLTVSSDTESIILYGEKQSGDSTLTIDAQDRVVDISLESDSYLGTFGLSKGENVIKINITNQGYTRTYIITITRELNSDKELLSLVVRGNNKKLTLTPEFTVGRTESYSLTVDKETNMLELTGTVSELATVSGLGDVYLEPGLNVVNIVVTAEDGSTQTYTINVTKEASSEAHLIDLIPSSGSLSPVFGYETTIYNLDLDSSVLSLSFDATAEDGNAVISGLESQIVPDGESVRTITVTAEDKTTVRTYTINVSKIISDDADLLDLAVKDYNFVDSSDETTKVTFNKDNLEYYVIVSNDKKTLDKSDIILTKSNAKAKVVYSDLINLNTKNFTEYSIMVNAEDGINKKNYKVFAKRMKGSESAILKVSPTVGYLETAFFSDEYNYVWKIPASKQVSLDKLGVILKDENATIESFVNDKTLTVKVTSEDGSSVSTYVFTGEIDYNKNVLINELRVYDTNNDYPYEPELSDDDFEYTAHVYDNLDKVSISLVPQVEGALVLLDGEDAIEFEVDLPEKVNEFEFIVQGEDGVTEQPYTIIIKKDILTEETISSLEIVDEDNVCTTKTCIISPKFDPNTTSYRTSVPYEYDLLNIDVGLNEQQSYKLYLYNGDFVEIQNNSYELEIGNTDFYIFVYDMLGKQTKSYKLSVTKNKSTNTKLNALSIKNNDTTYELQDKDGNPLPFSNDINEYYITVPYDVDEVEVLYTKNVDDQKVKANDYNNFYVGETNDITVKVTAPDKKTIRTIIIHAYRESQYEVFLNDITVASGYVWNLSPAFDKRKTSYVVNVTNGTEYVKVEGFADSDTQVSEAETRLIDTGVNEFEIVASKIFDGEVHTKTYTVTVIRPIASEVYLSSLKTSSTIDGEYTSYKNELGDTITFDRGTTDYYLEVSPGVKNLNITATAGREEWNVNIYGNNFATGKNIVSIIVYNEEYTTSRTYQLMVTVKPSEDSSLTGIRVYDENEEYGISNEDFEASEDNTYTVNVPYDVEKVSIDATPTVDKSIVVGKGEYYLDYGNNELSIYVEAEDGVHFTVYTVNVYRAYDLYLSDIKVDEESIEDFVKTNDTYEITVTNDVEKMLIEGIPEEDNVTVTYSIDTGSSEYSSITEDGTLYTGVGLNKVLITVTAPDNTYKHYHVNITREQSDNNYLEYLEFAEGIFREPFEKTRESYTMYILDTYTSLNLSNAQIIPEDSTANYAVSGYSGLSKTSSNIVTVSVTSESGKVRNYTVEVILKPESFFMHYLKSLKLTYKITTEAGTETHEATLSPIFAEATRSYTVTVPYSVSSITVNAIPLNDDDDAILTASTESGESLGDASYSLNFGRNVISIKVTSRLSNSDGSFGMYKVIVYRSKNATATLQSLAVKDHLLTPTFNSNRISYNINIDSSEKKLDITAIPTDPGATVELFGNGNFQEGNNTITIKVTAADGTTVKNYFIIANCTLSDNNYLKSMEVKDQSITPTFVKTNTGVYLANVDENVSNVYITGVKEDPSATLTIVTSSKTYTDKNAFSMNLMPGNNFVYFQVRSVAGNIRTYTLNVFRSYSTDNRLKELVISDGTLVPDFDPEETNYTVTLDNDLALLNTVTAIGFKNHNAATVMGNGEYTLNPTGTTTVVIKVIAQSGDEREYKINFVKMEAPSSKLKVLDVHEGELDPSFSNDGYKYYLTVPYEVKNLDLTVGTNVFPEDDLANVTITGNENFKVGINIVTIKVTATNNDTKTYLIYVTRSILASNYLSDLYVEDYSIEPEFNSDTLYYELTVGSNIEKVHVFAEKDDPQSTLEINGSIKNDKEITLDYGENKVYFTVTSENGASRTYTLVVTRSDSDEYYLLTLETNLGTWDRNFNKDDNGTYVISVPAKTNMIVFTGTTSVGSTVEGLDSVQIKNGENTHKIVVTSPSGLKNTYSFTINRPSATNANATITSDQGDLTLESGVYKRSVDDSVSSIKFTVTPEDSDATVVMNDLYHLDYGNNEITIKVVAEDGVTEKEYNIEIYRYKDIESITYEEDEIILNVGANDTPTYVINPTDTDYKEVTFRSDDEGIATVDSTGKITGVGNGITYVYVSSAHNDKIYDWIKVNVASTKITSSVYTVWHLGDSENELASVDFSYVIGANDKTSIDDFFTKFDNNVEYLKVYSNNELITNQTTFVGSGMILKLEINGNVYDEVVIVVRGDNGTIEKPGNGIITSTDYATLSSILAGLTLKTPMTSLLYDLNKNKILTVTDLSPLSLFIAGKATFTNLNGL